MSAELQDPNSWDVVLLRCPKCNLTVIPAHGAQHVSDHFTLRVGDYITRMLRVVPDRRGSDGIYVGRGRAKFWDEPGMTFVGTMGDRT